MLSSNNLACASVQAQVWPAVRVILDFLLSLPQIAHCRIPLTSLPRTQHQSLMRNTDITLIASVSKYNRHPSAELESLPNHLGGFLNFLIGPQSFWGDDTKLFRMMAGSEGLISRRQLLQIGQIKNEATVDYFLFADKPGADAW